MTIKARLLVIICVLIALAFTIIGGVTVSVTRDRMIARVDDTLRAAPPLPEHGGPGNGGHDEYSKRATATIIYSQDGSVQGYEPSGFANNPDPLPALSADDLAERSGTISTVDANDGSSRHFRVLIRPISGGGYLALAAPLDDVDHITRTLEKVIAIVGIAVLTGVVLSVWYTIQRGLRPIDDMIATAGVIAGGDLRRRVEVVDETTEVGQLADALNAMLAQIESSFAAKEASEQRLRRFVADASHELRTPLTSIRGYAELYRSGAVESPEALERVMRRIESEGARMGKLVEDLLLLARLDQGRPLQRAPLELGDVVEDAVAAARVVEPERPIALERAGPVEVTGDADRLRQVVDNLLANVRAHTAPGTPVRVRVEPRGGEALVSVADDGPGMAPGDAARAFDRFYRVDESRSRAKGGAGLGLSIVASIVEAHGGRTTLDTAPGEGTTVTIALPQRASEPALPAPPVALPAHAT